MNFLQNIGAAGLVGGIIMLAMSLANVTLPRFSSGGGTLAITLPSDTVIIAVMIGGVIALIAGTAMRRMQGDTDDEDEDDD